MILSNRIAKAKSNHFFGTLLLALLLSHTLFLSSGFCLPDDWHIDVVDTSLGYLSGESAVALDSSGNPHIAYFEGNNDDLRYAHWDGSCWQISTVDAEAIIYWGNPSIAIDSADSPHIAYYEYGDGDLRYAYWDGSSWQISVVDGELDVGECNHLVMDSLDRPHIAYFSTSLGDIKYARWDGSIWHIETVDDDAGGLTQSVSLALDDNEYPHITYCSHAALTYAHWDGSSWQIDTLESVGSGVVGVYSSIALDSNDYPHISYGYYNIGGTIIQRLQYRYWTGTYWYVEVVDEDSSGTAPNILSLDSLDHPCIAYIGYWGITYAHWDGTSWQITVIEGDYTSPSGSSGGLSLDLNEYDQPSISYDYSVDYDTELRYAWYGETHGIILENFSAKPQDTAVNLTWQVYTTEGEEIIGFDLYRRELSTEYNPLGGDGYHRLPDDEWLKINPSLITGENPYSYTDNDVEVNTAYEYTLEAVLADDSPETLGTAQATTGQPTSFAILKLYPNPASNYLTCLLSVPQAGNVEIKLYDLAGRMVMKRNFNVCGPMQLEVVLDVSGVADGVYILFASVEGMEDVARVVVCRYVNFLD